MTFTSNSLGFRGPEPAASRAGAVVFLGDSFTMGFGVSDGEEFPALFKKMLDAEFGMNAFGVVNAGMGDNGNGRWIKLLRTEVDQFKPQLVVLQVMANDFGDNVREAYFGISDRGTLDELPVRVSKAKALDSVLELVPGLSSSHLYGLIRQAIAALLAHPGQASAEGGEVQKRSEFGDFADRLTELIIAEAVSVCGKKGYPVFAILVGLEGERLSRLQSIFEERRVPTLVTPTKAERPDLYYKIDGHWNSSGHTHVARAVFDRLKSLNLVRAQ